MKALRNAVSLLLFFLPALTTFSQGMATQTDEAGSSALWVQVSNTLSKDDLDSLAARSEAGHVPHWALLNPLLLRDNDRQGQVRLALVKTTDLVPGADTLSDEKKPTYDELRLAMRHKGFLPCPLWAMPEIMKRGIANGSPCSSFMFMSDLMSDGESAFIFRISAGEAGVYPVARQNMIGGWEYGGPGLYADDFGCFQDRLVVRLP